MCSSDLRLIAFLALRGPTPRVTVAGTLWPDTTEDRALASLRTAVWRLRRLTPDVIAQRSATLALGPGVSVDTAELGRSGEVVAPAGGVLPELLPGWYDDWVVMERERQRHRFLRVLETAAATAIDRGQPDAGLDRALVAVAADPLRESAHRLVIQALLAAGNLAAARRHLALVRRIFTAQLGAAPSDQLTRLFDVSSPAMVTVE